MLPALALTLALGAAAQQPSPQSPTPQVHISPAAAEVAVGSMLQLRARVVDAAGRELPGAAVQWFSDGEGGQVDSTGLLRSGYRGTVRVVAVAMVPGVGRAAPGQAVITVVPSAAVRVSVSPAVPTRLLVGARLGLVGTAWSAEQDERSDRVVFTSSRPAVIEASPDGRLTARAPGRAVITATAGQAVWRGEVEVLPNPVARLEVEPALREVRTGDVIRFRARALDARGREVPDATVRWALAAGAGVAQVDGEGAFVAEVPGSYVVTASLGAHEAEALVRVAPRRVGRGLEVLGRVPIAFSASEVWVHPGGACAYLATIADRVYAIDLTGSEPRIVDSMMVDARIVNDVMTTEDGRWGVFSREGASNRRNGIVIFDAANPCHPRPVAEYTETVSGGVHSSFVYQGHVYLTDDATGSLRVIDIRDPRRPREVGRWQTEQTEVGRYLHDVAVDDGLAYLSYWNDGLVILDVGNGVKGGRPDQPVLVGQARYDLDDLYARVNQYWGLGARGTHTAWRSGRYVFVGDEVYAARPSAGLEDGNNLTFGRLSVFDVSDLERPELVAWYAPEDAGVHNIWVAGDTLYMGAYQGGVRVLDISGELRGDLLRQGREVSWMLTADRLGHRPRATFTWGAVVHAGRIYVPDINTGLWILRLEPATAPLP